MALEFIGEIAGQFLGEIIGYVTGRFVIPVLSLGTARGERFSDRERLAASRYWWRDGRTLVFSHDATLIIGILFWVFVGVAGYLIYHRG